MGLLAVLIKGDYAWHLKGCGCIQAVCGHTKRGFSCPQKRNPDRSGFNGRNRDKRSDSRESERERTQHQTVLQAQKRLESLQGAHGAGTAEDMLKLSIEEIERYIFSCGFYKHKAKFLHDLSYDIVHRFGGQVPSTKAELESLAGVGKKTANVVYAVGFGGQAIAVDTHVFRVSNRLGIANAKNVATTQKQLEKEIPQDMWSDAHHWLLLFGRYVCKSQNPNCQDCYLKQYCKFIEKRS